MYLQTSDHSCFWPVIVTAGYFDPFLKISSKSVHYGFRGGLPQTTRASSGHRDVVGVGGGGVIGGVAAGGAYQGGGACGHGYPFRKKKK